MATDEIGDSRSRVGLSAAPVLSADARLPERAQRALTFGLLLSALRCTAQYLIFPFVLPWIGVTAALSRWLTLALCMFALAVLARNVRYMWILRHPRLRSYLVLAALVAASLLVFLAVDLQALVRL